MPYWAVLLQVGLLVYLLALFLAALRSLWGASAARRSRVVRYGLFFAVVGSLAVPVNSSNVFAYIGFDRIATIHGANSYRHSCSEFNDDYSRYAWFGGSMPYGSTVLPLFAVAGYLSKWSVLSAVFLLKVLWLLCYGLTLLLLAKAGV